MVGRRRYGLAVAALVIFCTPSDPVAQNSRANPLLAESTLAYGAPAFDIIRDTDFEAALLQGMAEQRAEIQRIASNSELATFKNTLEALELSGALLNRVSRIFNLLREANTTPVLQRTDAALAAKLASHRDDMLLDVALFARVRQIYDSRAALALTPEQLRVVDRYYREFVRAGAALPNDQKERLRQLNAEESELTTSFRNKIRAGANSASPVFDRVDALRGLSTDDISAAALAADERNLKGRWVLPLLNTTQQPALTSLKDRSVRERLFNASVTRNSQGGTDTTAVVARLAQLRAQRAALLGYESHAAFILDDQMAKTPRVALKLLTDLVPAVAARAKEEASSIQQQIDSQGGRLQLKPWDWQYYAEEVRKKDYAFDESQVRPYFELNRVLNDGVFFAANKLYGITLRERKDIPVYHPDVRVFEVFDKDGTGLGLFYADFFARQSKRGGGWTSPLVVQSKLLRRRPVTTNNCNFVKPAPGQPALLTSAEVTTMFHEFGHALNNLFSTVEYPKLTRLPQDFTEVPSQFNEHWALESQVFKNYARHHATGEPMPASLEEKIRKASTFNQGFATAELLAVSLLDMGWHTVPPNAPLITDVDRFEQQTLEGFGISIEAIPPRYGSRYFSHIWNGNYSAGYYSYLWSEVIETDAYDWLSQRGGLTRENGQRFRDMILSKGSTIDADEMYRAFRGRDADVEPMLVARGLKSSR